MMQEDSSEPDIKHLVPLEKSGRRLDLFLAEQSLELSRSRVQKLIQVGAVFVDKKSCYDKDYRLQSGEEVTVYLPLTEDSFIEPEKILLDIIYEDSDLLVVNKPRGMVVHPAPGHARGTLVNALLNHCPDLSGIGGVRRPGIIHRLDKDTSGLLIVAKNDFAHRNLSAQLKARKIKREYIALVSGCVIPGSACIEAPIGRHPVHRKKMAVIDGGREAVTRYRVLKYFEHCTLLRLKLETGRTHQIRVHLAHLGFPVLGDPVYALKRKDLVPPELVFPQALHACRISFHHPISDKKLVFSAILPADFKAILIWLKSQLKK